MKQNMTIRRTIMNNRMKSSATLSVPAAIARDGVDRQLIALLQANARESTANLARRMGLARTTVLARLARLQQDGVVVGFTVRLGQDQHDTALQAYVGISVSPKAGRAVEKRLARMPELRQLSTTSGEMDYMAVLRAPTAMALDALLDEIGDIDGVVRTTTSIVLARRIDRS